jgi:hypothetical protein
MALSAVKSGQAPQDSLAPEAWSSPFEAFT